MQSVSANGGRGAIDWHAKAWSVPLQLRWRNPCEAPYCVMKMPREDGLMDARRAGHQRLTPFLDLPSRGLGSSTPQTAVAERHGQGRLVRGAQGRLEGQTVRLLYPSPPLHRVAPSLIDQQLPMLYPCRDVGGPTINTAVELILDSSSPTALRPAPPLVPILRGHQDSARLLVVVHPVL